MGVKLRVALILLLGILSGALRDFLFINLNYQIDHVRRGTSFSYAHSRFQGWVQGWELADLLALKWILAASFVAGMWLLCVLLLRSTGCLRQLLKPVSMVFLIVGASALLLHALARWIPVEEASVNLLHAIQYPVLLVVLLIGLVLFPRIRERRSDT